MKALSDVQADLLEFVPTHMVFHSLEMSGSLVMQIGSTPEGHAIIQYQDGARSKVNPYNLVALPEDKEK